MSEYKNLTEWCAEYSKKTGVKIYPQSAPLQLVIEDLVGQMNDLHSLMLKLAQENIEITKQLLHATQLINSKLEQKEDKKTNKKEASK